MTNDANNGVNPFVIESAALITIWANSGDIFDCINTGTTIGENNAHLFDELVSSNPDNAIKSNVNIINTIPFISTYSSMLANHVVTTKPDDIRDMLYKEIDRGVTYLNAQGAYTGVKRTMVVCAMEKHEAYKIMDLIDTIDPEAFCYVTSTKEIIGKYDHKYDYDTD